jgi:PKHD-type hydroxylase
MQTEKIETLTTMSNFWLWTDGLSNELCDLLLKERATLAEETATVVGKNEEGIVNKETRDSSVCWAPQNHWIEGVMYNYGLYAAESTGWNFQLGRPEQIQLIAYDENGFYGWHEDWSPFAVTPVVRKVSVVVLLSDPKDFEGGVFQFDGGASGGKDIEMKRGSVLAFPSFLRHQVTPVTAGKRYSAVCWINGPRIF